VGARAVQRVKPVPILRSGYAALLEHKSVDSPAAPQINCALAIVSVVARENTTAAVAVRWELRAATTTLSAALPRVSPSAMNVVRHSTKFVRNSPGLLSCSAAISASTVIPRSEFAVPCPAVRPVAPRVRSAEEVSVANVALVGMPVWVHLGFLLAALIELSAAPMGSAVP